MYVLTTKQSRLSFGLPAVDYGLLSLTFAAQKRSMKLSHLSHTLIGSEIVKLGGEIRDRIRKGERIYNFTVGDFDPQIFPIPHELEDAIVEAYRNRFTNYPPGEGSLELREAVIRFTKEYQGLDYSTDEI